MKNRLPWNKMHLDLDLGKRHLAVFLGSVAALIVLALTPQLLGDLVADGVDGPLGCVRRLALDRRCGVRQRRS